MDEYIKKEALMIALCKEIVGDGDYYNGKDDMQDEIRDMVSRFPAADVAPVRHAKVIDKISDDHETIKPWEYRYYCSACKIPMRDSWNKYCPNCGCKMDLEDKNNE